MELHKLQKGKMLAQLTVDLIPKHSYLTGMKCSNECGKTLWIISLVNNWEAWWAHHVARRFTFAGKRSISCILSHISTLLPRNYEWWYISARKVCLVGKEINPPARGCWTLRVWVEVFADSSNSSSNLWDFGPSRKIHVYCNLQFVRDALRSQKGLFLHSPPPHLFWNLFNLINCVLSVIVQSVICAKPEYLSKL